FPQYGSNCGGRSWSRKARSSSTSANPIRRDAAGMPLLRLRLAATSGPLSKWLVKRTIQFLGASEVVRNPSRVVPLVVVIAEGAMRNVLGVLFLCTLLAAG